MSNMAYASVNPVRVFKCPDCPTIIETTSRTKQRCDPCQAIKKKNDDHLRKQRIKALKTINK